MPRGTQGDDDALTPGAQDAENLPDGQHSEPSAESQGDTPEPKTDAPQSFEDAIAAAFDAPAKSGDPASDVDEDGDDPDAQDADGDTDGQDGADADEDTDRDSEDGDGQDTPDRDSPGQDEDDDPTEEELASLGKRARRRVQQLLRQRAAARTEAEGFKPDAENYRTLRSFMEENQLEDRETADLMLLGADLKSGDPQRLQRFIDAVEPILQFAREATGQAIPQDLQEQVDDGEMSEAAAQQVARHRHEAQIAQARMTNTQQRQQVESQQASRQAITQAVNGYLGQLSKSDPDYARHADAFRRVAQGYVAEKGLPDTPDKAVEMAKEAWTETKRLVAPARPQPRATRPSPSSSASTNRSGVKPAPASLEDAIAQAMDGPT